MKRAVITGLFILCCTFLNAQDGLVPMFPKSAVNLQYAGSTGFLSVGFFKVSKRDKLELGILYGMVPKSLGGLHQTLSLKFLYNPFQLNITKRVQLEPLQAGGFMCQNFNKDLERTWGPEYERGYYWWTRSLRFHFFVSSQVSYKIESKHVDRLAAYFEANTNDLYILSYGPNMKTMRLYDIFFFGAGLKLYVK